MRAAARIGLILTVALAGCRSEPPPAPPSDTARAAREPARPPAWDRTDVEIRRGEPLDLALRRLELTPNERQAVTGALATEVDLRRILPGESVEVARDREGRLREAALRRDLLRSVVVSLADSAAPRVELVEREAEIFLRCLRGTLDGSLYESVLAAGGDANLTMRYADLLAWQVDFLTEPRQGDRFLILVEEEHLDSKTLGFGKILAAEYAGDRASARALRYVTADGTLDWYDDEGRSVRRAFLKSPLNYRRITSGFSASRRHPVLKKVMPHWGVDYAAARGTPVSALGSGVVQQAGRNGGFGNYIEIRHNSTYTTCYGHLSKFAKGIRAGVRVEQGEVIGYVGATGLATAPHLDFRVKKNGNFVNPLRLESPPGRTVPAGERERFAAARQRTWTLAERIDPGESVAVAKAWERVPGGGAKEEVLSAAP